MTGAENISLIRLIWLLPLLAAVALLGWRMKLGLGRTMVVSVIRMTIQLLLVGLYLQLLFDLNNPFVNVGYTLLMTAVAAYTGAHNSGLALRPFAPMLFFTLAIPHLGMLLFFNGLVVGLSDPFTAVYLIPVGGMLLGNSMRANIIALNRFFGALKTNEREYLFRLSMGASRREALAPLVREAVRASAEPALATMATLGLVSLPGMMTGQMLGGSSPIVAIKYQIAIMAAIFIVQTLSVMLTLFWAALKGFDPWDGLRRDLFAVQKSKEKAADRGKSS